MDVISDLRISHYPLTANLDVIELCQYIDTLTDLTRREPCKLCKVLFTQTKRQKTEQLEQSKAHVLPACGLSIQENLDTITDAVPQGQLVVAVSLGKAADCVISFIALKLLFLGPEVDVNEGVEATVRIGVEVGVSNDDTWVAR